MLPLDLIAALPAGSLPPQTTYMVRLGPLTVVAAIPEIAQESLRFFRDCRPCATGTPADFRINLTWVPPEAIQDGWGQLAGLLDQTYRSERLRRGYYVTEHFGSPGALIVRGSEYFLFGSDFDKIVWGYLVKALLTRWAVAAGCLHLKAAAFTMEDFGTLVVGRGGGGKTVLLHEACRRGAEFVSNTHVILDGLNCIGVASNLKVRQDAIFYGVMPTGAALIKGEVLIDPIKNFGWREQTKARLNRIIFVDYQPGAGGGRLEALSAEDAADLLEQYALAYNVYGQKEDYRDYYTPGVFGLISQLNIERNRLLELTANLRCLYLSADIRDAGVGDRLLPRASAGAPAQFASRSLI